MVASKSLITGYGFLLILYLTLKKSMLSCGLQIPPSFIFTQQRYTDAGRHI